MNSRAVKIAVSLLLTASLLCCSVSVFADNEGGYDPSGHILAKEYMVAYYIWNFLKAIGIDVSWQGVVEYNDYIQDTIIDWVVSYIGDLIEAEQVPSTYNISNWIAPWQADFDYWGNLRYNDTMLEDLEDFAAWLKRKFSLVDDDSVVVNPEYTFGGYTLYETNKWYAISPLNTAVNNASNGIINIKTPNGERLFYTFVYYPDKVTILYLENHTWYAVLEWYASNDFVMNQSTKVITQNLSYWRQNTKGVYWNNVDISNLSYAWTVTGAHMMFVDDDQEFLEFMSVAEIQMEGNVYILTGTVQLPSENPGYQIGDGVTIIDGEPEYGPITFSGEITNLPAIVSTGEVTDPEIDQIYTNIPPLVEEATGSMEVMRQIIFRMPDEVLIALYALLAAGVIFGFLRIMREH